MILNYEDIALNRRNNILLCYCMDARLIDIHRISCLFLLT